MVVEHETRAMAESGAGYAARVLDDALISPQRSTPALPSSTTTITVTSDDSFEDECCCKSCCICCRRCCTRRCCWKACKWTLIILAAVLFSVIAIVICFLVSYANANSDEREDWSNRRAHWLAKPFVTVSRIMSTRNFRKYLLFCHGLILHSIRRNGDHCQNIDICTRFGSSRTIHLVTYSYAYCMSAVAPITLFVADLFC